MNTEIYTTIKDRILFLEYRPGEILNENVLAGEFGVSRTPMREILNRLAWEKLARVIPRTGTMITEIEFQQMMNIYRARFEIEGLAGRLAAQGVTPDHLAGLETLQKDCREMMKHDVSDDDKRRLVGLDRKYREILYDAAGNPVVTELSQGLYEQSFRLWYTTLNSGERHQEVAAMDREIGRMHETLAQGDPWKAYDVRREMLVDHFERIKTKFLGI